MALDFPTSPTVGQQYGGYVYDGVKWKVSTTSTAPASVQPTPPTNPTVGDMWFNSTDGTMYFYYNDGNTSQWVESRAPIVANGYYSPNYVINGGFDIWQRGTSFTNPGAWTGYTADRWLPGYDGSGATRVISRQEHTPGTEPYQGARYFLRWNQTVAGSGGGYNILTHRVEGVQTLAGKTATVSLWMKASANAACAVDVEQSFGSGGSSPTFTNTNNFTATTSWQRFSFQLSIPSISGKTIGTSDYLALRFFMPVNSVMYFDIAGVQLEEGSAATTFRRNANSLQGELAACQRYYSSSYPPGTPAGSLTWTGSVQSSGVYEVTSTSYLMCPFTFPVPMRTSPTMVAYSPATGAINKVVRDRIGVSSSDADVTLTDVSNRAGISFSATGQVACRIVYHYTASAEL